MSIESFISSLETRQIHLTNVNYWDDKWEVILDKLPEVDDKGKLMVPNYSFYQYIYGQCWTRLPESDAMWRIYSPTRTGIQVATSVQKFNLIGGVDKWCLDDVVYFESVEDLLEKSKKNPRRSALDNALYKRSAFSHEEEVRFLTHGDSLDHFDPKQSHVALPVDVSAFIEGVTIDPRAADWFVDAITRYCERSDLAVRPVKSVLYESDPHLRVGLVRRWVPIGE
jgi:hypothetical protein